MAFHVGPAFEGAVFAVSATAAIWLAIDEDSPVIGIFFGGTLALCSAFSWLEAFGVVA